MLHLHRTKIKPFFQKIYILLFYSLSKGNLDSYAYQNILRVQNIAGGGGGLCNRFSNQFLLLFKKVLSVIIFARRQEIHNFL